MDASSRAAAWLGFAFGLGLFGAGASWVYVALAMFGGMAGALAALATIAFCVFLALFPALAGWATARIARADAPARLVAAAGFWAFTEWLRSWIFTGFPWLTVGYARWPRCRDRYREVIPVPTTTVAVLVKALNVISVSAA